MKKVSLQIPLFFLIVFILIPIGCLLNANSLKYQQGKLKFDIGFLMLYHSSISDSPYYSKILLPDFIRKKREDNPLISGNESEYLTDNPLFHGASCIDLSAHYELTKGISLHANLVCEHRGISYGPYSTPAMIVYPYYKGIIENKFQLFGRQFKFYGSFGHTLNARLYEGLNFYNIDVQGIELFLKTGHWKLKFHQIGDLFNGIGLNIGDLIDYSLSIEDISISSHLKSHLRLGVSNVINDLNMLLWNFSFSLFSTSKPGFSVYSQVSFKSCESGEEIDEKKYDNSEKGGLFKKKGLLLGFKIANSSSKFQFHLVQEFRYFSKIFNAGFINEDVCYRDPNGETYNNTIGPNLYPLYLFNRPFSQWAVYTEYQSKDVLGISSLIGVEHCLYKDINIILGLDFNVIFAEAEKAFFYPFYNVGFSWVLSKNAEVSLSLTNKAMNLDVHYPTFYLLQEPYVLIKISKKIDNS